jgi:hypothetical protein
MKIRLSKQNTLAYYAEENYQVKKKFYYIFFRACAVYQTWAQHIQGKNYNFITKTG